jgi:hypothetical protein
MDDINKETAKPLGFGALLAIPFGLANLGSIIEQTVRWTNPLHGFVIGLFHVFIYGFVWVLFALPLSLLIESLYRWRKWQRFRTHWVLAPAFIITAIPLGSLFVEPPFASTRFAKFTQTTLPENMQNFRCDLSGWGIGDYFDTYYFETTPEEFERLRMKMKLSQDAFFEQHNEHTTSIKVLPKWPDYRQWVSPVQYRGESTSGCFYCVITDASKRKVYIFIGTI